MLILSRRLLVLCISAGSIAIPLNASDELTWPQISSQQKPWTRWWWPGSAVDKKNLSLELQSFAAAGWGGVEITPIYGAKGAESRFVPFLSDKYLELLKYTADEAHRLGLGVDMATGTGWPFGGPGISAEFAEQKINFKDGSLAPRPSLFHVKRAAPGGEGLVVSPFSADAMRHYLLPFTEAFSKLPAGAIRMQFHDSYEYTADWDADLPEAFERMHGYDLKKHIAELSGEGDPDVVARIKSDYRETLAALHLDYIRTWVAWVHDHGQLAREQAHGAPANLLDLYALADIPETEAFGSTPFAIPGFRSDAWELGPNAPQPLISRFSSSAAHVSGKPFTSSETFTWLREHFHEAPSEMKPEVDQLFLCGINHVFYHGSCYSPEDVAWPGWVFYASTQFNSRNPLWPAFAELNQYIARSQSLLQAGQPDNDILIYWPVYDQWHDRDGLVKQFTMHSQWLTNTPVGQLMKRLIENGFSFDLISDDQIKRCSFANAAIRTEGGQNYRTILVPKTEHMSVSTLHSLLQLAEQGACITFLDELPKDVPGFARLSDRRQEFQELLAKVQQKTKHIGKGRITLTSLNTSFSQIEATHEPMVETGVQMVRRRLTDGYLYFIANLSANDVDRWIRLGTSAKAAGFMDALTGRTGITDIRIDQSTASVYLQLKAGASIFLRTFDHSVPALTKWKYWKSKNSEQIEIRGKWSLTFSNGGPTLPKPQTFTALKSWTDTDDEEARRFGGSARYEIEFEAPENRNDEWLLQLGDVREFARVNLNGKDIENLWSIPFEARVGQFLRSGKNILTIDVTNLGANRIRDLDRRKVPWKNFYEINFVNIRYRPFDASDWPLQPSGLLGPVKLISLKSLNPEKG